MLKPIKNTSSWKVRSVEIREEVFAGVLEQVKYDLENQNYKIVSYLFNKDCSYCLVYVHHLNNSDYVLLYNCGNKKFLVMANKSYDMVNANYTFTNTGKNVLVKSNRSFYDTEISYYDHLIPNVGYNRMFGRLYLKKDRLFLNVLTRGSIKWLFPTKKG